VACSSATEKLVNGVEAHPLFEAAHLAFTQHRPLLLSPDIIWFTIAHGFAQHVRIHSEELRKHFVDHDGKQRIVVKVQTDGRGLIKQMVSIQMDREDRKRLLGEKNNPLTPEQLTTEAMLRSVPFVEAIDAFACQVRSLARHADVFQADFSTTGPCERLACDIVVLDVLQHYFNYEMICTICGIPRITLEGTPDDWMRLKAKVSRLSEFGLDWWTSALLPLCDQFIRTSQGMVDREFWRNIYKFWKDDPNNAYSPSHVTGWLGKLVPYLLDRKTEAYTRRNPALSGEEGPSSGELPAGFSHVPFLLSMIGGTPAEMTFQMEFIGGFIGVAQDPVSLVLRPRIGWGVLRT